METTGLDEGDVDTTGLERKPGNEDLFITGLEEPLQKGETAPFAPTPSSSFEQLLAETCPSTCPSTLSINAYE